MILIVLGVQHLQGIVGLRGDLRNRLLVSHLLCALARLQEPVLHLADCIPVDNLRFPWRRVDYSLPRAVLLGGDRDFGIVARIDVTSRVLVS